MVPPRGAAPASRSATADANSTGWQSVQRKGTARAQAGPAGAAGERWRALGGPGFRLAEGQVEATP
eukprot:9405475-Alexandrium_andersonii.AAC.1